MIPLRYSLALILALMSMIVLLGAVTPRGDDVLPSRLSFDRYAAMVDHSPFAIATAAALPPTTSDFAKDLYIANVGRTPDGDMVTIASISDANFKKYLTTREPVDGYRIVSVEWSDRVGATKVTISKDEKFATLTFNEALLSQRAASKLAPVPGQIPQSIPLMPSSGLNQFPTVPVPGKIKHKPGASFPNLVPPPNLERSQKHSEKQRRAEERKAQRRRGSADSGRQ
jgi:hypothetical protein